MLFVRFYETGNNFLQRLQEKSNFHISIHISAADNLSAFVVAAFLFPREALKQNRAAKAPFELVSALSSRRDVSSLAVYEERDRAQPFCQRKWGD